METPKERQEETPAHADNNVGTVGLVTENERKVVISSHHSPNPTGYAENEEDHHTRFSSTTTEPDPRDSISDRNH
jgi:hypothetical protein